ISRSHPASASTAPSNAALDEWRNEWGFTAVESLGRPGNTITEIVRRSVQNLKDRAHRTHLSPAPLSGPHPMRKIRAGWQSDTKRSPKMTKRHFARSVRYHLLATWRK